MCRPGPAHAGHPSHPGKSQRAMLLPAVLICLNQSSPRLSLRQSHGPWISSSKWRKKSGQLLWSMCLRIRKWMTCSVLDFFAHFWIWTLQSKASIEIAHCLTQPTSDLINLQSCWSPLFCTFSFGPPKTRRCCSSTRHGSSLHLQTGWNQSTYGHLCLLKSAWDETICIRLHPVGMLILQTQTASMWSGLILGLKPLSCGWFKMVNGWIWNGPLKVTSAELAFAKKTVDDHRASFCSPQSHWFELSAIVFAYLTVCFIRNMYVSTWWVVSLFASLVLVSVLGLCLCYCPISMLIMTFFWLFIRLPIRWFYTGSLNK